MTRPFQIRRLHLRLWDLVEHRLWHGRDYWGFEIKTPWFTVRIER